jgi:hypothetical protein
VRTHQFYLRPRIWPPTRTTEKTTKKLHVLQVENIKNCICFCVAGSSLKVCTPQADDQGTSCCTSRMESALAAKARQQFDQSLQGALQGKLATVLRTRATKFNGQYTTTLPKTPYRSSNSRHLDFYLVLQIESRSFLI